MATQIEMQRMCSALAAHLQCSTSVHCKTSEVHINDVHRSVHRNFGALEMRSTSIWETKLIKFFCCVLNEMLDYVQYFP